MGKVARIVHQVRHTDPAEVFQMLVVASRHFREGGPHRIVFTIPSLVVATLRLVMPLVEQRKSNPGSLPKVSLEQLFDFVYESWIGVSSLQPEKSLPIWLLCATTTERADRALHGVKELKSACAKFIDAALVSVEKDIKKQKAQFEGLTLLVGSLREIRF